MDGGAVVGFVSIGVLTAGNIVLVAYNFGKIKQKVDDLCGRVGRLEDTQNNKKEKRGSKK